MPTFRQAAWIPRAMESLHAQGLDEWEVVIVDDGSPDDTEAVVARYLDDPRVRYYRLPKNRGVGAALNFATDHARGRYIAYLPCDDLFYPEHLARLLRLLEEEPEIYAAYSGVEWEEPGVGVRAREASFGKSGGFESRLRGGEYDLAFVQVMHRRTLENQLPWITREELVSDRLEERFWSALHQRGARFAYAGAVTCRWATQGHGQHKLIAGPGSLPYYRRYHGIGSDEWLNWQPSRGPRLDERARYGRFDQQRDLPQPGGLKILLAGTLGFNPERIVAFEQKGHKLYGLWHPEPEAWDAVGPFPFGNVEDIPFGAGWQERVRAATPDVIYALLNAHAVPMIAEIVGADLGIPLVFHFKEGPFICQDYGTWPLLVRILTESAAQVFISEENYLWFQQALHGRIDPERVMILDGDLPKREWLMGEWSEKRSALDGHIHTVCAGRPLGLDPVEEVARVGIHVHFYGDNFHEMFPNWLAKALPTGHVHLHRTVEPEDWVRELSQYDAGWPHIFESHNQGDLRRAFWSDLNLPARLNTYAAAGLPWILKANRDSVVTMNRIAEQYGIGVFFTSFEELADQLHDRARMLELTINMRAARPAFAFDTHVDRLVELFRRVIADS